MNTDEQREPLLRVIIDLATDIWRLHSLTSSPGNEMPPLTQSLIDRLSEDLVVNGVELINPTGDDYDHNLSYEVVYVTPGEGGLFVSETLSPGIRIDSRVVAKPRVCLAPREVV